MLDALADDIELALETRRDRPAVDHRESRGNEDLLEDGLRRARAVADEPVVGRDVAPAEDLLPFLVRDLGDQLLDLSRGRARRAAGTPGPRRTMPASGSVNDTFWRKNASGG